LRECRCSGAEAVEGVLDFQFGRGVGRRMLAGSASLRGREVFSGGVKLGELEASGVRLTLAGAERLADASSGYVVELNFYPRSGNVLAPGVRDAGEEILPGDEVAAVYEGEVVGAGRAVLSGVEMLRASRGVCAVLREVKGG